MTTEWDARAYHDRSALQSWLAEEALPVIGFEGAERVLDVGCGDGHITAAIAAHVPRGSVLGVDASPAMIEFARRHAAAPAGGSLAFAVGDARRLGFRAEFDLVVSFNALHWVQEQGEALGAIHAALRPGGRAFLQFVPRTQRVSLEDVIDRVRRAPRWTAHFEGQRTPFVHPTAEAFHAAARRHHFTVERLEVHLRAWDFGSREAFAAFARVTFVEWTKALPAGEVDDFVSDVLDAYGRTLHLAPGEVRVFHFDQLRVALGRP